MSDELRLKSAHEPLDLEALRRKESRAWQQLIEHYAQPLRGDIIQSLFKRGLGDESTDDILQETWLTALQNIESFNWRSDESLYHWLRVISLNHVRRRAQKAHTRPIPFSNIKSRSHESSSSLDRFLRRRDASSTDVEKHIQTQEDIGVVQRAIDDLKHTRDQDIVLQWLLNEAPPRVIAAQHGIKASAVSQFVWRFVTKLRNSLNLRRKD